MESGRNLEPEGIEAELAPGVADVLAAEVELEGAVAGVEVVLK